LSQANSLPDPILKISNTYKNGEMVLMEWLKSACIASLSSNPSTAKNKQTKPKNESFNNV
jgi:hypothetical protein